MKSHTSTSVPTEYVEANGIRFAFRRFGACGSTPIVLNQHFKGTLDHWDPLVTDGLGRGREVILFDNAGVAASSGEVPVDVSGMARNAIAFITALGLEQVDLLGFSLGGLISQEIVLQAPALVRKLILVSAGFRGADMSSSMAPKIFSAPYPTPSDFWLAVHFTKSEKSQSLGSEYLERTARRVDRDLELTAIGALRQRDAIGNYLFDDRQPMSYLGNIRVPAFLVYGGRDLLLPPVNGFTLQQALPDGQLSIYPDAGHGPINQYPELFVDQAVRFLDAS